MKVLTGLSTELSQMWGHNFKYSLQDILNPICMCNINAKPYLNFFFIIAFFKMKDVFSWSLLRVLTAYSHLHLRNVFLFGNVFLDVNINSFQNCWIFDRNSYFFNIFCSVFFFPITLIVFRVLYLFVFLSLFLSYPKCS